MIKCVYNRLELGHNLVKRKEKRPKSNSVTGVTGGVVTPKDKTRVLLPNPFVFLHCWNAKIDYRTFDTNEIIYLKDKNKSNCSFGPCYRTDSCFGNKQGLIA